MGEAAIVNQLRELNQNLSRINQTLNYIHKDLARKEVKDGGRTEPEQRKEEPADVQCDD